MDNSRGITQAVANSLARNIGNTVSLQAAIAAIDRYGHSPKRVLLSVTGGEGNNVDVC